MTESTPPPGPSAVEETALPPGPLTAAELSAAVSQRTARRHYRKVWNGVYRREDQADDLLLRSLCLALITPAGVLCGRSAAVLWGDDSAPDGTEPEVWLPTTRRKTIGRRFRSGALSEEAITVHPGIGLSVTTPLRTARDLTRDLAPDDAVVALERMCGRLRGLDDQLRAAAAHPSGRGGLERARFVSAVDRMRPGSPSAAGSRARVALDSAGLDPEVGYVMVTSVGRIRVALALPAMRTAVAVHPSGESVRPPRYWAKARQAGWTVLVATEERERGRPVAGVPAVGAPVVAGVPPQARAAADALERTGLTVRVLEPLERRGDLVFGPAA